MAKKRQFARAYWHMVVEVYLSREKTDPTFTSQTVHTPIRQRTLSIV